MAAAVGSVGGVGAGMKSTGAGEGDEGNRRRLGGGTSAGATGAGAETGDVARFGSGAGPGTT